MDTIDMISGMSGSIALVLLAINSVLTNRRLDRLEKTALATYDKAAITKHNTDSLVNEIIYKPITKAVFGKKPFPPGQKAKLRRETK